MYSASMLPLLVTILCQWRNIEGINYSTRSGLAYCIIKCDASANANHCAITLNSSECSLRETVKITQEDSLTVTIQGKPTNIRCTREKDAGLWIEKVSNFTMRYVTLSGCGAGHSRKNHLRNPFYFRSAVLIENCTTVTVQRVKVVGSSGTGMTIINTGGKVRIVSTHFESNSLSNALDPDNVTISGGGGLYIELCFCGPRPKSKLFMDYCSGVGEQILNSKYFIIDTVFMKNDNTYHNSTKKSTFSTAGFGFGGGMALVIGGKSRGNSFTIERCIFSNNRAVFGGGLYIVTLDESTLNTIGIFSSNFTANRCNGTLGAGGAINGEFLANSKDGNASSITMQDCYVSDNQASSGGGGSFFAGISNDNSNVLQLINCYWKNNSASFGAAIGVSPNVWVSDAPTVNLIVRFNDNKLVKNNVRSRTRFNTHQGTIWADRVTVMFSGYTLFEENSGSALVLYSSGLLFDNSSHAVFRSNRGIQGGAVVMTGLSVLKFYDDSRIIFDSNNAEQGGGALFHQTASSRDIATSRTCFIQYAGSKSLKERNTTFMFVNNSGSSKGRNSAQLLHYGHSILTTTIKPCQRSLKHCQVNDSKDLFCCIGNFSFVNKSKYDLSTLESKIEVSKSFSFVPGKPYSLEIKSMDEYSNEVDVAYHVYFSGSTGVEPPIKLASETYTNFNKITLYGRPGENATLILESISIRRISCKIKVKLLECPPGYAFSTQRDKGECVCSQAQRSFAVLCQDDFHANILYGYWMGYISEHLVAKQNELLFSYCPFRRCSENSHNISRMLPGNTNKSQLDFILCGESRTGVLCSQCRPGYFMNYHSYHFICRPSPNKCRLGWLYYILSELIPVTIFFVTVMLFDVRLISGSVNGLILFLQLSNALQIEGYSLIRFNHSSKTGLKIYYLMIGLFNMNFFVTDELSYCMWSGAKAFELLTVNLFTIFYALGLVVATILCLKYCSIKTCTIVSKRVCKIRPGLTPMIHGLSSFLVVCYSEAVRVCLLMLTPTKLYSDSGIHNSKAANLAVASLDGDILFFQGKHLFYAIPALLILAVLGLGPPLLLFTYPLCYKLFKMLGISESQFVKVMCTLLPLEKCKPFFDSFQSGFKDDCRFFAGLYFLYRLTALIALALVNESQALYGVLMVQFVAMLFLQAIFQPQKNPTHNVVDMLLFTNLFLITLITALNYSILRSPTNFVYIKYLIQVQLVLLYLPIISAAIYMTKKVLEKIVLWIKNKYKDEDLMNYQIFSFTDTIENRQFNGAI